MNYKYISAGSNGVTYMFVTKKTIYKEHITGVTRFYKGVPKYQFYNCRLNWDFTEYNENDKVLAKKRNYPLNILLVEII